MTWPDLLRQHADRRGLESLAIEDRGMVHVMLFDPEHANEAGRMAARMITAMAFEDPRVEIRIAE